jgi:hypothetical protein
VEDDPVNSSDPLGLFKLKYKCRFVDGCTVCTLGDTIVSVTCPTPGEDSSGDGDPAADEETPSEGEGDPGGNQSIIVPLPTDLRKRFAKLLARNDCKTFVQSLIRQAATDTKKTSYSDDPMELFDMIVGQGGYVLERVVIRGRSAGGTVSGSIGSPELYPATVLINPNYAAVGAPSIFDAYQESYVGTALHETIHLAGTQSGYSDLELADAVFKLGLSEEDQGKYHDIDRSDPRSASGFWGGILNKHCR